MSDPISFWARRRAAVRAEKQSEKRAAEHAHAAQAAAKLAERPDEEILAELDLPDPETLQAGDDFSGFMSRDVPEHLRRQALRTLWRSNPVLACVDGLNEYDDDYRAAMLLQEPIKTAYQVGRGMLKHIEEMERKQDAAQADAETEADAVAEVQAESTADAPGVRKEVTDAHDPSDVVAADAAEVAHVSDDMDAPAPRRMRFRFEATTV